VKHCEFNVAKERILRYNTYGSTSWNQYLKTLLLRKMYMAESNSILVVGKDHEPGSAFACLSNLGYSLVDFSQSAHAIEKIESIQQAIVIIDIDRDPDCYKLAHAINTFCPDTRVILVGDFRNSVFPENIPRIFNFIGKPLTEEKLIGFITKAQEKETAQEKRREPRVDISLPVELYYDMQFWRTRTRNLSLHGMQTEWEAVERIDDIQSRHSSGVAPISACRLYLDEDCSEGEHINISVDIRYISTNDPSLLGFEFRELDLDLRSRLQDVVVF